MASEGTVRGRGDMRGVVREEVDAKVIGAARTLDVVIGAA
jgi:hypothetical protein